MKQEGFTGSVLSSEQPDFLSGEIVYTIGLLIIIIINFY